jgi:hypothetical protein
VDRGGLRQAVGEDDGQARSAFDFDQRTGMLPVEGEHRIGPAIERASHRPSLEPEGVAITEPDQLSGPG